MIGVVGQMCIRDSPGAGAARGMGGGLLSFFNAELKPGTELLLKAIDLPNKKPFTIMLPPPNVTGQLHMGHALDNTMQDILLSLIHIFAVAGLLQGLHRGNKCSRG